MRQKNPSSGNTQLNSICLAGYEKTTKKSLLVSIETIGPRQVKYILTRRKLLLHHVLVKMAQIEETQRQLIEKNAILDKISSLVQVVIKSTGKFEQLEKRVNELESSVTSQGEVLADFLKTLQSMFT